MNHLFHSIRHVQDIGSLFFPDGNHNDLFTSVQYRRTFFFIPFFNLGDIPQVNPLYSIIKDDHIQGIIRCLKLADSPDAIIFFGHSQNARRNILVCPADGCDDLVD